MTRVAIIGSGIAGLAAAHVLGPSREVVVYEADGRTGGHANTVSVEDPVAGSVQIDTGFIVHNDRNYPNLVRLFDELGVSTQASEMSFGVNVDAERLAYRATSPRTLFADPRNAFKAGFWRMLADIPRFWRDAKRALATPDPNLTLEEFLDEGRYSTQFVDWHLIPMGAAIWSADPSRFAQFPAVSLFRFLANHGLLGIGRRPNWRTVVGGSRSYVDAITDNLRGEVRLNSPVERVARVSNGVEVTSRGGHTDLFDEVVMACHADQALAVLVDASAAESEVLSAIKYQPNDATLHTDTSVLAAHPRAWAAWNYHVGENAAATLTYDLTLLQQLPGSRRYLVSLNIDDQIDESHVIGRYRYAHPVFDSAALRAQERLPEINGADRIYFAGAWAGYGFHEDGINAALAVTNRMGVRW